MNTWPEDENVNDTPDQEPDNVGDGGETAQSDEELTFEDVKAINDALTQQNLMHQRDFAKEVATYMKELVEQGIPPQMALALTREMQQMEYQYRLQMDIIDKRMDQ